MTQMTAECKQQRVIMSAPVKGSALPERGQDRPASFLLKTNAAGEQEAISSLKSYSGVWILTPLTSGRGGRRGAAGSRF